MKGKTLRELRSTGNEYCTFQMGAMLERLLHFSIKLVYHSLEDNIESSQSSAIVFFNYKMQTHEMRGTSP